MKKLNLLTLFTACALFITLTANANEPAAKTTTAPVIATDQKTATNTTATAAKPITVAEASTKLATEAVPTNADTTKKETTTEVKKDDCKCGKELKDGKEICKSTCEDEDGENKAEKKVEPIK